ncbi:TolB family protein [Wenyingzhuangia sp. IMCC45467]
MTLVSLVSCYSQQYFGGHPLGQDWQVIKTSEVNVIHPKGMTAEAERIARIINYIHQNNTNSVGKKAKNFDLVLQTQTTNANGYVGLAPLRSEFFGTPPQSNLNLGSLEWLDVLAIHEYRHVLQNVNAKNGIVHFLYFLGGESFWAVANNLVLPNWYYEGDAVISETALTLSGRGRNPYFTTQQRALIQEELNYSYTKHRNGSYKDMLPNHYPLGYMMLSYLKNHYGNNITRTVLIESTSFKGIIYPFSKAIKRNSSLKGTKDLYKKSWNKLKEKTVQQLNNTKIIETKPILNKDFSTVTSYSFPIFIDDKTIIARKKSYNSTDEIVKITHAKEEKITSIGINNDDFLSYNHQILAWTETTRNARRGLQDFSDVILYDLNTNQKKRLTKHTRYFSPSVSPDGTKIAVINIDTLEKFNLCIIDAKTGSIQKTFKNIENDFLSRTTWTPDGKHIISIHKRNGKLCMIKHNIINNKQTELTPWTRHTIETPTVSNTNVYFNASFSGIDNIYKTDLNGSKKTHQISSVPVGAYQPNVINNKIIFTEFTSMGYVISQQKINRNANVIKFKEPVHMEQFNTVANKQEGGNILTKIDSIDYTPIKYHSVFSGLKLHTWGIIPSPSVSSVNLRAVNILNDLAVNLTTEINHNENNNISYSGNVIFSKYYPEFTLSASKTNRSTIYDNSATEGYDILNFNETHIGFNTGIPLTWYRGNFVSSFLPYAEINQFILNNTSKNNLTAYETGFTFSSIKRTAYQNLGPKLGMVINASKMSGFKNSSSKINLNSTFYLPGFSQNHYTRVRTSYQKESLSNPYQFNDSYVYPRGYNTPLNDEFKSISINYHLPLAYPDFGFLGLIYFKRIKANLFYDYGVGTLNKSNLKAEYKNINYNSTGTELLFDNVYFNILPITAGIRYNHLLKRDVITNSNTNSFQFILGTNLSF